VDRLIKLKKKLLQKKSIKKKSPTRKTPSKARGKSPTKDKKKKAPPKTAASKRTRRTTIGTTSIRKKPAAKTPKTAKTATKKKKMATRTSPRKTAASKRAKTTLGSKRKAASTKSSPRKKGRIGKEGEENLTWVWQFKENDNKYYNYDSGASDIVEGVYQEYLSNPQATDVRAVKSGDWQYMVDFRLMTQQNIQHNNHTVRNIRRVQVPESDKSKNKLAYD